MFWSIHWLKTSKLWHRPPVFSFLVMVSTLMLKCSLGLLLTFRTLRGQRQQGGMYWTDGTPLAFLHSLMQVWLSGKQFTICGQGPHLKRPLWGFNNYFLMDQFISLQMSGAYRHMEDRGWESQCFGSMKTWDFWEGTWESRDSNLKPTSISYQLCDPRESRGFLLPFL